MKIDSTPLHHLSEDHKSRIKIDNYGITDNNDIVSYTGAENGKILTAQQYGATSLAPQLNLDAIYQIRRIAQWKIT